MISLNEINKRYDQIKNNFKSMTLPNSTMVKIESRDSDKLHNYIHLHNIFFVPSFHFILLSLLKFINVNHFLYIMITLF